MKPGTPESLKMRILKSFVVQILNLYNLLCEVKNKREEEIIAMFTRQPETVCVW